MSRSAGLLLVLGLTLGLWIGFTPQTHRQAVRTWDQAKSSYADFQSQASVKVRDWTTNFNTQVRVNPKSAQRITSSRAWEQVSTTLDTFWNSVQRMWTNLTTQANLNV